MPDDHPDPAVQAANRYLESVCAVCWAKFVFVESGVWACPNGHTTNRSVVPEPATTIELVPLARAEAAEDDLARVRSQRDQLIEQLMATGAGLEEAQESSDLTWASFAHAERRAEAAERRVERALAHAELMRFAYSAHEKLGNAVSAEGAREQVEELQAILTEQEQEVNDRRRT